MGGTRVLKIYSHQEDFSRVFGRLLGHRLKSGLALFGGACIYDEVSHMPEKICVMRRRGEQSTYTGKSKLVHCPLLRRPPDWRRRVGLRSWACLAPQPPSRAAKQRGKPGDLDVVFLLKIFSF